MGLLASLELVRPHNCLLAGVAVLVRERIKRNSNSREGK